MLHTHNNTQHTAHHTPHNSHHAPPHQNTPCSLTTHGMGWTRTNSTGGGPSDDAGGDGGNDEDEDEDEDEDGGEGEGEGVWECPENFEGDGISVLTGTEARGGSHLTTGPIAVESQCTPQSMGMGMGVGEAGVETGVARRQSRKPLCWQFQVPSSQ